MWVFEHFTAPNCYTASLPVAGQLGAKLAIYLWNLEQFRLCLQNCSD